MSGAAYGTAQVTAASTDYNVMQAQIKAALAKVQTLSLVEVISCTNNGGVAPVGTVTVKVLANLMTGNFQPVQHGEIFEVPYLRAQGGGNAIILDPVAGDLGLCGFCSRDISGVKAAKGTANPGSSRMFDWADAIYINGTLNGTPTQYLQFGSGGITILSPSAITLNAPTTTVTGALVVDGASTLTGAVTADSTITATGVITSDVEMTAPLVSTADLTVTTGGSVHVPNGSIPDAALANSGVTAGSYTNANITVTAAGIITAASNGSSSGYTLEVTDGTTSVSGVDVITFVGATVSGTAPNVTVTITGGGGGSPGGSPGSIQWNNSGAFDGLPSTWDGTNLTLQGANESTGTGGAVNVYGGSNGSGGQGGSINIEAGEGDVSNGYVLISGAGGDTPGPGEVFLLTDTILTLYTNGTLVASIGGNTGTTGQALVSDGSGNVVWGSAGGGSSLELTDGTHTVTGVTEITVSGATVGGTSPNATLTIAGGSSEPFNITVDSHGTIPTGVGLGPNDEFEYGTSIDTAGARYTGATAWTWGNQSTATATVSEGSLLLVPPVNDSNIHSLEQPLPASGNWTYQTKITQVSYSTYNAVGMILRESSTGKILRYCAVVDSVTQSDYQVDEFNSYTSYNSTLVNGGLNLIAANFGNAHNFTPIYVQLSTDGTNYYFAISLSGMPGTFLPIFSSAVGGWFSSKADTIGLFALSQNSSYSPTGIFDWFRRTA